MIKREELKGPSCLTNAADNEPLFVLRANDELAPNFVRAWAAAYKTRKEAAGQFTAERAAKYHEAMALATDMEIWNIGHGTVAVYPGDTDADYHESDEEDEPEESGAECGRWRNGVLDKYCTKAGSEECDFECPYR